MNKDRLHILLADDDLDDCNFFNEALSEIAIGTELTVVNDGVALMELLSKKENMPDLLFLDLNMPKRTGYECLVEIKESAKLQTLAVIIFSTSYNPDMAQILYDCGANYYISKPASFTDLVKAIEQILRMAKGKGITRPPKSSFLIQL